MKGHILTDYSFLHHINPCTIVFTSHVQQYIIIITTTTNHPLCRQLQNRREFKSDVQLNSTTWNNLLFFLMFLFISLFNINSKGNLTKKSLKHYSWYWANSDQVKKKREEKNWKKNANQNQKVIKIYKSIWGIKMFFPGSLFLKANEKETKKILDLQIQRLLLKLERCN